MQRVLQRYMNIIQTTIFSLKNTTIDVIKCTIYFFEEIWIKRKNSFFFKIGKIDVFITFSLSELTVIGLHQLHVQFPELTILSLQSKCYFLMANLS